VRVRTALVLRLLLVGLVLATSAGLEARQDANDLPARYAQALKKLGSDEYAEREAATAEIGGLPADAIPLVESTLSRPDLDPELRTRLGRAIVALRERRKLDSAAKKTAQYREWSRKTTREAYDAVGRKDAKWDDEARAALDLMSVIWSDRRSTELSDRQRAWALTRELVGIGCDDPLILTSHAQMYDNFYKKEVQRSIPLHVAAARAMKEFGGAYAPMQQALALAHAVAIRPRVTGGLSEDDRKETQAWLDLAQDRYLAASKAPDTPEDALYAGGKLLVRAWTGMGNDRKVGFDKISDALAQARPASTLPLLIKGGVYVDYAWDARGHAYADKVTDDGWKKMGERLREAEAALKEAWEKQPDDPRAPTIMINVELGQGKGRSVMETWFARAMASDPDNIDACRHKMYYLEPKWYGNAEEMLKFGRELLAGGRWDARLPFLLVEAHETLAGYEKDHEAYFRDESVWRDLKTVYEGYLPRHPEMNADRSRYAKLACWCGQYGEAKKQFDLLGDRVSVGVFAGKAELLKLKAEAAEKGR
jgi:hypothetical protein